jgi:cysteine desulfurase
MKLVCEEINKICKDFGVIFHSDMAQALHGEKFDLTENQIDAVSISGHKIYGPKGIGALILNHEPSEFISPVSHGGLQEQDIRSGTVPVFLTVGLSEALYYINKEHEINKKHLLNLREIFVEKITSLTSNIKINYASKNGHPGTLNIHFKNIDADIIATRLANDVAVSTSAACNGIGFEYSYVLKNMHLDDEISKSSIRLCFSKYNTFGEANKAANLMYEKYKQS